MPSILVALMLFMIFIRLSLLIPSFSGKTSAPASFTDRFECGFESFRKSRLMFSFKFYLVLLIFLVFDVEVVVRLPLGLVMGLLSTSGGQALVLCLFLALLLGLVLE